MERFAKSIGALIIANAMGGSFTIGATADNAPLVSFVRQVAPILVAKCQGCHGQKTQESNYRLDAFELMMKEGDSSAPPVTANRLEESELYRLIISEDPDERMPNNGDRLSEAEIKLVQAWILQGATFDGDDRAAVLRTQIPSDNPHPAAPATYRTALPITALTFSADGSQLVVGGYHELLVSDPAKGVVLARLGNMPQRTFGVSFSADGSWLAVAGGAPGVVGEVRLIPWINSAPGQESPRVLATGDDVFFDVAFRPDGKQVAAAGWDGSVRVFESATGVQRLKISNHADWITDVCYSLDGALIATASRDKSAKVFDGETGRLIASYSGHAGAVHGVAFAADGKAIISAAGNSGRVWRIEDSTLIGELPPCDAEVQALLTIGDNILAASADRTVRQFALADRVLVRSLVDHPARVISLAWNESTHRLATGCFNGIVTIWNLDEGSKVQQFLAVPPAVAAVD